MKKIAVFGATGETGKLLVEQALASGDEVVAYVRSPSKLATVNEHLSIVQGELSDAATIERVVSGVDAVISILGPRGGSKNKPLTQGIQNIIEDMKKQGIRRLIITSTLSAKDPNDKPEFRARLSVNFVKLTMNDAYQVIVSVAEAVRASDLDWTIVRLTMLNNNAKTGNVRVGYLGKGQISTWTSRANLADFLLSQTEDLKYVRQTSAISN